MEGRQGYGSLRVTVGQGLPTVLSVVLLIQPQLVFRKSTVSTNKVGRKWICGSWELFTKGITLQIVHSVSGDVAFQHRKQFFVGKCTISG